MSTEEKIQYFRRKGNNCFKNRKFSSAISYYKQGLEYDTKNEKLNSNLAQAYLEQCDFENAEHHAVVAIGSNIDSVKGYFRAAKATAAQGNTSKAMKYLQDGIGHCTDTDHLQNYLRTLRGIITSKSRQDKSEMSSSENEAVEECPPLVSDSGSESDEAEYNDKSRSRSTSRMTTGTSNVDPVKMSDGNKRSYSTSRSTDTKKCTKVEKKSKKARGPLLGEDIFRDPFLNTLESIKSESNMPRLTSDQLLLNKRKELQSLLKEGSEVLANGLSRKAVEKYKAAFDMIMDFTPEVFKLKEIDIIIVKYSLCVGWIELANYSDVAKAVEYLEEIEKNRASKFPAVFYGLGSAYYKLNRYKVATEHLEKGLLFLSRHVKFEVQSWPGTDNVIPETTRNGLEELLKELHKTCRAYHEPDAICRYSECLNISTHIIPSEQIFYSDPDFCGFVIVICEEKCRIEYHLGCWKEYKEIIASDEIGKLTDKDFIGRNCPTTDCVTPSKKRSVIVKIEIIGDDTTVKASIETPKTDAPVKETKKNKKKKNEKTVEPIPQTKKVKSRAKNKKPVSEPVQVPAPQEVQITNSTEGLETRLQKLKTLREINFGYTNDTLWCPHQKFYGRKDVENLDHFLSPEYTGDSKAIRGKKDFLFSYFYEFIKSEGPQKVKDIEVKWQMEGDDFEGVKEFMNSHNGICSFLLQSYRFASIDDYICLAEQLPDAYSLSNTELSESLFFTLMGCIKWKVESSELTPSSSGLSIVNDKSSSNSCDNINENNSDIQMNCNVKIPNNIVSDTSSIDKKLSSVVVQDDSMFNLEADDIEAEDPDINVEDNPQIPQKEHLVSVSESTISEVEKDDYYQSDAEDDLVDSDDYNDYTVDKNNVEGKHLSENKTVNEENKTSDEVNRKTNLEDDVEIEEVANIRKNDTESNQEDDKSAKIEIHISNGDSKQQKDSDNSLNPLADDYKPSLGKEKVNDILAEGDVKPSAAVEKITYQQTDLKTANDSTGSLPPSDYTHPARKWSLEDGDGRYNIPNINPMGIHLMGLSTLKSQLSPFVPIFEASQAKNLPDWRSEEWWRWATAYGPALEEPPCPALEEPPGPTLEEPPTPCIAEEKMNKKVNDISDKNIQTEVEINPLKEEKEKEIKQLGLRIKELEEKVVEVTNLQNAKKKAEKELMKEKEEKEALKNKLTKDGEKHQTIKKSLELKIEEQNKKIKELEEEMVRIRKEKSDYVRITEEELKNKSEELKVEKMKCMKEKLTKEETEKKMKEMMRDLIFKTGQEVKELKECLLQSKNDISQYQQFILKMRKETEEYKIDTCRNKSNEIVHIMRSSLKHMSILESSSKIELTASIKKWEDYLKKINDQEIQFHKQYRTTNEKLGNMTTEDLLKIDWPQLPEQPDTSVLKTLLDRLIIQDKEIAQLKVDNQKTADNLAKIQEQNLEVKKLVEDRAEKLEKRVQAETSDDAKENRPAEKQPSDMGITDKKEEPIRLEEKRNLFEHVPPNMNMNSMFNYTPARHITPQTGFPLFQQTIPYVQHRQPYMFANTRYPLTMPVDYGAVSSFTPVTPAFASNDKNSASQLKELVNKSLCAPVPERKPAPASNIPSLLDLQISAIAPAQNVNQQNIFQKPESAENSKSPLQKEAEVKNVPRQDKITPSSFGLTPIEKTKTVATTSAAVSSAANQPSSLTTLATAVTKQKSAVTSKLPESPKPLLELQCSVPSGFAETKPVIAPVSKPKSGSSYQTLMTKLRNNFPTKTEEELAASVAVVREKNNNSLSGLSLPNIIGMVDRVLKEKASKKQGSMGLEKFGGNAWGGVRNVETTWSKPKESSEDDCIICMDPMDKDQTSLHCKHTFHTKCIRTWLKNESVCPICRLYTRMVDEFPPLS